MRLKRLKNINERLRLTDEEKEDIERRIKKEVICIRSLDSLVMLSDYLSIRKDWQLS